MANWSAFYHINFEYRRCSYQFTSSTRTWWRTNCSCWHLRHEEKFNKFNQIGKTFKYRLFLFVCALYFLFRYKWDCWFDYLADIGWFDQKNHPYYFEEDTQHIKGSIKPWTLPKSFSFKLHFPWLSILLTNLPPSFSQAILVQAPFSQPSSQALKHFCFSFCYWLHPSAALCKRKRT